MNTDKYKRAVGIFAQRKDIQSALRGLKYVNFPLNKVSVIAKDTEQENEATRVEVKQHIHNKADGGVVVGTTIGSANAGLTGILVDLGILVIPEVGPIMLTGNVGSIMLAGAEATTIASAIARCNREREVLANALITLGIPGNKAKIYSDLVEKGYYLLIVDGNEREIAIASCKPLLVIAEMIFRNRGVEKWDIYYISAVTPTILNKRYQYAVGLFFLYRDLESALNELRQVGFPMEQVTVVAKSTARLPNIYGVGITAPQYNFAALEISDDIAKHYNYRVLLGDYLLLLSGTAIQLAAAQNILEKYQIQNYATFHPYLGNSTTVSKNST